MGRLITLGSILEILDILSLNILAALFNGKRSVLIWTKTGWAAFLAIYS
jgi:hypothetical protein